MRLPIWLIVFVVGAILVVGLISLPFTLFMPWDSVFGDGGLADRLLNFLTYGLIFIFIVLPFSLGGVTLVWQPGRDAAPESHAPTRDARKASRRNVAAGGHAPVREPYRIWKAAIGLALIYFSVLLVREIMTSDAPFPSSREDAARRAAQ